MIKGAPLSFAGGLYRSFLVFLMFILILAVWAYYPVQCGGMSWIWAVATAVAFSLALWLFCHLIDWANGVVQALAGGVEIDPTRLLAAVGVWLLLDAGMWLATYQTGVLAFGDMRCSGINIMTIVFTSALVLIGVIGEITVFSLLDLPNDALDSWVASHASREPTPQIEVLKAQKMLHDVESANARARLAQMRAKQEEQLLGPGGDDLEWSLDEEMPNY